MESIEQEVAMKTFAFDIKVAFIGYVSVGKSTVLNALLGDKFSQVALKRTTAGVNFFRIAQHTEGKNAATPWSVIDDDKELRDAEDVHKEITTDNKELRSNDSVNEKTFDIKIGYPICKMREDTRLVLIDIPGINEAESSKKYKDYVKSNWKSFDCVVVVMDATEGVNTEEQVDLLKFVQQNNQELKDIPTIVLGNKMDDLDDEDTIHLIEETRSKTIEIFGNVDCKSIPDSIQSNKKGDLSDAAAAATNGVARAAFVPLSAKNAFTYMKALCINLEELGDPKNLHIVNKIGDDEYGRKWKTMSDNDKIDIVRGILQDKSELDERLGGTNFNAFLSVLSDFIGGDARQQEVLRRQFDVDLETLRWDDFSTEPLSKSVFEAFQRCKTIGRADFDTLQEAFWLAYHSGEDGVFENILEKEVSPASMERLFLELEKYYDLTLVLQWTEESIRTAGAMKKLLCRQLRIVLKKLESWSFEDYCIAAGGTENRGKSIRCQQCSNTCCNCVARKDAKYFICSKSPTAMEWKNGWSHPEHITWCNLSPHDWIVILNSISLVWNQSSFIEHFGAEKVALNEALMEFNGTFVSRFGMYVDPANAEELNRICLKGFHDEMKRDKSSLKPRIKMPSSLVDPSHWGFLSWKFIMISGKDKRKALSLSE